MGFKIILKYFNLNNMDVVRFRKLAYKSTLDFGKYKGFTINDIINLGHTRYLRWVYFNFDMLSFIDEILDKIYLYPNYRIEKPGKNPEMGVRLDKYIIARMDDSIVLKNYSRNKRVNKAQNILKNKKENWENSKFTLQAKNQGKN